jgi:hypothetical protein
MKIAQSFSPFWQEMGDKFVALVGSGRQTCHPSHDKKGLKDWAILFGYKGMKFQNKKISGAVFEKGTCTCPMNLIQD